MNLILTEAARMLLQQRARKIEELAEQGCGICGAPATQIESMVDPATGSEAVRVRCDNHGVRISGC